jgi:hypothetical protein
LTRLLASSPGELLEDDFPDSAEAEALVSGYAYEAAKEAKDFWSEEAGRNLNTTRERYQAQISIYEDYGDNSVAVVLNEENDRLVGGLESGSKPYDMKAGLLDGRQKRIVNMGGPGITKFKTVTQAPQNAKWQHPGFPGLKLVDIVEDELDNAIIPKYTEKLFKDL